MRGDTFDEEKNDHYFNWNHRTNFGGIHEKDLTLQTAQNIQREITKRTGANVILTRDKDEFLTLDERVEITKNHAAS